jgi:uncharacterized membrane protein YfcA
VIHWPVAVALMIGSVIGGWGAGHLIQKVPAATLRWIVVAMGAAMGLIMLLMR